MDTVKTILLFLVLIAVIVAIFYGIWKWGVNLTTKRSKVMPPEALLKSYKGTGSTIRWGMAAVAFLFFGGPFGAAYFYFFFKKINEIYRDELLARGIAFDPVA